MVGIPKPLVTEDSNDVLAELRYKLGAKNDSDVVRKALALSRIVLKHSGDDGTIKLIGKDGEQYMVSLR